MQWWALLPLGSNLWGLSVECACSPPVCVGFSQVSSYTPKHAVRLIECECGRLSVSTWRPFDWLATRHSLPYNVSQDWLQLPTTLQRIRGTAIGWMTYWILVKKKLSFYLADHLALCTDIVINVFWSRREHKMILQKNKLCFWGLCRLFNYLASTKMWSQVPFSSGILGNMSIKLDPSARQYILYFY